MVLLRYLLKFFKAIYTPIRLNARYFFFMYLTGIVTAYAVVPNTPQGKVYDNLWLELFLDLYVVCVLLTIIPRKIRQWVRFLFATVAYLAALADVFCFVKFQSTLNPTMLLLAGETDSREAGEFLGSYVTSDLLSSSVGLVLLIMIIHLLCFLITRKQKGKCCLFKLAPLPHLSPLAPLKGCFNGFGWLWGGILLPLLIWAGVRSAHNKQEMVQMFSMQTPGQIEHELTTPECAQFYQPLYRLAFSIFTNHVASQQVQQLIQASDKIQVDSCSFRSPDIVLIIGESYNKYHSQLYGYDKATTPRQLSRQQTDHLAVFTDVVAPWNLTSFVFKKTFSLHVAGQQGDWCDYPLFPEVFRKAGYQVVFLTNQFLPKAREAVYDFSGGFFLNHPELSKAMFDIRNEKLHYYDEGLLTDFDKLTPSSTPRLTIFHVMGQHVNYHSRYPKKQRKFYPDDYDRPDLSEKNRSILSHYDNAVLYNDSIADQVIKRFEQREAIIIFLSDHGEECFNDGFKHFGRNHNAEITPRLAHQEFDIPFWIWCSPSYAEKHPDIWQEVTAAKDLPMMIDALPHMLLYLAGIHTQDYHEEYNVLSPRYDKQRPRVLKNTVNYNQLIKQEHGKEPSK